MVADSSPFMVQLQVHQGSPAIAPLPSSLMQESAMTHHLMELSVILELYRNYGHDAASYPRRTSCSPSFPVQGYPWWAV
jgi:hypothetical protein